MVFSYNWLQDYFEKDLPKPDELVRVLSLRAYEVEGVEEKGNDYLLDLNITPNRAHDSFSYIGLAKEVAILFDLPLKLPKIEYPTEKQKKTKVYASLEVEDPNLAPRCMKRVVLNVEVKDSPEWLKEKLNSIGQKSINNIVDITNFVMWETGQPVHTFDRSKVKDGKIIIRGAKAREKITTLDNVEYELAEEMLVLADDNGPLDIAGTKGGLHSGIDEGTTEIILSVCNFNPVSIRKTSRALNLRTDASMRFEHGITPYLTEIAMDRLSGLVHEIAGGVILDEILDLYSKEGIEIAAPYKIEASLSEINKVLGTKLRETEVEEILNKLAKYASFEWQKMDRERYVVSIPPERLDLRASSEPLVSGNKEDLIEEIGRIYGYENIPDVLPEKPERVAKVNKKSYYNDLIRDILVQGGFSELFTYSFIDEGEIEVSNPLTSDKGFLRASLLPGLERGFENGLKYKDLLGLGEVKVFEIGKVFDEKGEHDFLALVSEKKESLEKAIQSLEEKLGLSINTKFSDKGAEINLDNVFEKPPEINSYDGLAHDLSETKEYKIISPYPFVLRDIAVWVPEEVKSSEVLKLISENAGKLLVKQRLFDTFKKEGKVSYAFRLVFQSSQKTLSDNEINEVMKGVENSLNNESDWSVR